MASSDGWEEVPTSGWEEVPPTIRQPTSPPEPTGRDYFDRAIGGLLGVRGASKVGGFGEALQKKYIDREPSAVNKPFGDVYESERQAWQQRMENVGKQTPGMALALDVVGTVPAMFVPGAQGQGLSVGARLLQAAKAGATTLGALSAAKGAIESDAPTVGGRLAEAGGQGLAGAAMGGIAAPAGELVGMGVGKAAQTLLPAAQRFNARIFGKVADKAAKAAEDTARSAKGSYSAAVAEGSRQLETLGGRIGAALSPEQAAANMAALQQPEASELASQLSGVAREKLPNALEHIESAKALADATEEAARNARDPEAVNAYARQLLGQRTKAQLKRYGIPIAGGIVGALAGHGSPTATLLGLGAGSLAGRGLSPTLRAVIGNNLLSPERLSLMTPKLVSGLEAVAGEAPDLAGRLAAMAQLRAALSRQAQLAQQQNQPQPFQLAQGSVP